MQQLTSKPHSEYSGLSEEQALDDLRAVLRNQLNIGRAALGSYLQRFPQVIPELAAETLAPGSGFDAFIDQQIRIVGALLPEPEDEMERRLR